VTTTTAPPRRADGPTPAGGGLRGLWNRQLPHYPNTGPRSLYLAITVLATVILYYELYVGGSVATKIIAEFGFSFTYYVMVSVVGNLVGAFASLFAGLADRWGRANLVVYGLLLTGLITCLGLPNVHSKQMWMLLFAILSFVEGVVLVATPALIRDFSPQVGRGTAMGFWTLGPVLGSLLVTEVSSHTLDAHPDWRFQFYVCGIVGLVVFVIAFLGLRELSPALRDQLMVSMRDRALIEARAAGIDPERALKGSWRQMLRFDVVGSAFAISVFLLLYYMLVGFLVVYFATVFGYSEQKANGLANWYWIANALGLVLFGLISDKVRVRKPFMVVGALISLVGTVLFALAATRPETSYYSFVVYFILSSVGGGMAYVAWMASFTETVEKHNPAATATGLAIWGWIIRIVVTVSLAILTLVVPATSTLVDQGTQVQTLAAKYQSQLATLNKIDPATQKALGANPNDQAAQAKAVSDIAGVPVSDVVRAATLSAQYSQQLQTASAVDQATLLALSANKNDAAAAAKAVGEIMQKLNVDQATAVQRLQALGAVPPADVAFLLSTGPQVQNAANQLTAAGKIPPKDLAFLQANGAKVQQAAKDNPHQWQTWWWVCALGQVVFLPFIFVMAGRWSPRRAREDEQAHEEMVQRELAKLEGTKAPA
jgi:ACS family D-galactonate transporter-like MFS transporter